MSLQTILITGGSGLVGRHLIPLLQKKGYQVKILSRNKKNFNSIPLYYWDVRKKVIDEEVFHNIHCIIHLAGANLGESRWTKSRKKQIVESRVDTAEWLFYLIKKKNITLKTFITASATGYYGAITSEKVFTETDLPAGDFTGRVCKQWEQAADKFVDEGIRTVKIRTGLVLAKNEGILKKLLMPLKARLAIIFGNGRQYMPWIHINDLCRIYLKAVESEKMRGAYNAVAPEHVSNQEFIRKLVKVSKKRYLILHLPSFLLKIVFGEMAEIILEGSRISSEKIIREGFEFAYPDLENALDDLS